VLFPRVADAIDALPSDEREALLLFAWEELSYQSVAEALEVPIGTVRSRLNRARARLRELLEPKEKNKVKSRSGRWTWRGSCDGRPRSTRRSSIEERRC